MRLKFKTRKILFSAAAIAAGAGIVGAVFGYIFTKPKATNDAMFYNPSSLNYQEWIDQRVQATKVDATTNRSQVAATKLTQLSAKRLQITDAHGEKVDAKSNLGHSIFGYGRAIFAIDDKQPTNPEKGSIYDKENLLSALPLVTRLLVLSGHGKGDYKQTDQDALDYIGGFLHHNQPFYGASLGAIPVQIVTTDDGSWYGLESAYDDKYFTQEYSPVPKVDIYNVMGSSIELFLRHHYSPNKIGILSWENKWANALVSIISSDPNNPFKSNFLYINRPTVDAWMAIVNDLFGAFDYSDRTNQTKQFVNSYFYQQLTAPADSTKATDNDTPKYQVLGDSIGAIKKDFVKLVQRLAITGLQNLKFSLLKASHIQNVKYAVSNMETGGNNHLEYGVRSEINFAFGFKKDLYERFKDEVFGNSSEIQKTVFGFSATKKTAVQSMRLLDSMDEEYLTYNLTNSKFQQTPDNEFHAVFGARSSSGFTGFSQHPGSFFLASGNIPIIPVSFNFNTGVYDQTNVDTQNIGVVNQVAGQYATDNFKDATDRSFRYNPWVEMPAYVSTVNQDQNYVFDANLGSNNRAKIGDNGKSDGASQKGYVIKNNQPGMNLTFGQIYSIFNGLANQEIEFYTDANNVSKLNDPKHDPATESTLRRFRLDNVMQNIYQGFNRQSRARFIYFRGKPTNNPNAAPTRFSQAQSGNYTVSDFETVQYNINSLGTAYTYFQIALELFQGISEYAATVERYNPNKYEKMHWTSIDDFNEAAIFYMINLGGARFYRFKNSYLRSQGANLYTGSINNGVFGANTFSVDGDSFAWEPLALENKNYNNFMKYDGFLSSVATVLNFGFGDNEFVDLSGANGAKISQQSVLDYSSYFFYYLSVLQRYLKLELFKEDKSLSEVAKRFIQVYEEEVLGAKYFVSQLFFNQKADEFATVYGYTDRTTTISGLTNDFTQQELKLAQFSPHVVWNSSLGGIDQVRYQVPDSGMSNKLAWSLAGFNYGAFQNNQIKADGNLRDTINYLTFRGTLTPEVLENINHSNVNANSYSELFAPLKFGYDQTKQQIYLQLKKNYILAN